MTKRPHIVIAGAGFGGLNTFRFLNKYLVRGEADITIIDEKNYFLFTPLLHEVATASIGERLPAEAISSFVRNNRAKFLIDKVSKVDHEEMKVHTEKGMIKYDYLVLALGSSAPSPGIIKNPEHTYFLKSLPDAMKLRRQIISVFEEASLEADEKRRKELLRFIIIGGGPTGVELGGEMREIVEDLLKHHPEINRDEVELIMIHGNNELLPEFHPQLRKWAFEALVNKGWRIILGNRVELVNGRNIVLTDGTVFTSHTIVWSGGIVSNSEKIGLPTENSGRIKVDDYLRVEGVNTVFAIGDNAIGSGDAKWPALAQAAVKTAKASAINIVNSIRKKELVPYRHESAGVLISIGRWQAIGEISGYPVKGPLVWLLWQVVYLTKFFSWNKRIKITIDWLLHVFSSRDISKF